uniref:Uncharacterized protein n=1 Tax=Arundo donax TaxID=35708 RepID=A0A0A9H581_ARUDO
MIKRIYSIDIIFTKFMETKLRDKVHLDCHKTRLAMTAAWPRPAKAAPDPAAKPLRTLAEAAPELQASSLHAHAGLSSTHTLARGAAQVHSLPRCAYRLRSHHAFVELRFSALQLPLHPPLPSKAI